MADSKGQYQKLPPGWDCKYDQSTGNCYYINYLTRAMQLEDPRIGSRYKQLQNERCSTESIPMQPMHGGSPYHVYPTNNLPAMRAFQAGPALNPSIHMSTSPLLSSRGHLELSPIPFLKSSIMQTPRMMANMSRRSTIQETSFTNPFDTDAVVAKIQNMFPTASENHIRLLLKRYYNREAVVISALQVEKHPVTMPGPFVTPPAQRHLFHSNSAFHMTPPARRPDIGAATASRASSGLGFHSSRTASPVPGGRFGSVMSMHSGNGSGVRGADSGGGLCYTPLPFHGSPRFGEQWRSSPRPSSPKMKLRYMKNIFPKADEMLLLDILADSDNNVQKASEKLISLGYVKRDFVPHISHRPNAAEALLLKKAEDEKLIPLRPKEYTQEEKEAMQLRLQEKYTQIAERIILMALESVNYAEDRAIQILQIVQEEDEACARKHAAAIVEHLQTTLEQDETVTDGNGNLANNAADNIITVVVETMQDHNNEMNCQNKDNHNATSTTITTPTTTKAANVAATKKHKFPCINVTTPTTATTQIILSNSLYSIANETDAPSGSSSSNATTTTIAATQKGATTAIAAADVADNKIANKAAAALSVAATAKVQANKINKQLTTSSTSLSLSSSSSLFEKITTKNILAHSNSHSIGVKGYLHGTTSYSSASILDKLKLSRFRDKYDSLKHVQRSPTDDDTERIKQQEFKSLLGRIVTLGHDNHLTNGPDENLLLADYVTWNGANPDISLGHKQLAAGPDASILSERHYAAMGHNPELCKGSKTSLVKGSIYAQLTASGGTKSANIKCN